MPVPICPNRVGLMRRQTVTVKKAGVRAARGTGLMLPEGARDMTEPTKAAVTAVRLSDCLDNPVASAPVQLRS